MSSSRQGQAFERELEPNTALIFASAERLVNERPWGAGRHPWELPGFSGEVGSLRAAG